MHENCKQRLRINGLSAVRFSWLVFFSFIYLTYGVRLKMGRI
jgi:hypothetical protein